MWKRSAEFTSRASRRALLIGSCGGALAAVLFGTILLELTPRALGQQAPPGRLPPGPMQEKARAACLSCHTAQIIVQQQLDRRVWVKEVDKMIRWGAPVREADREAILTYLVTHFSPAKTDQKEKTQGAGAAQHEREILPRGSSSRYNRPDL